MATADPPVPEVPEAIAAIRLRRVPRWGPTIPSIAMFVFIWLVFGCAPTIGFFWALANDKLEVLVICGIFGLPLTLVVCIALWRMVRRRQLILKGSLACCLIDEAREQPGMGRRREFTFGVRYRLLVDGKSYKGRAVLRGREVRGGLPHLPTTRDFAIVTYDPAKPKRSFLWGFRFASGRAWVPGLPKT
jgi:hypothetical protein